MVSSFIRAAAATLVFVFAAFVAPTAHATFPGGNGLLLVGTPSANYGVAPTLHFLDPSEDELVHGPINWPDHELPTQLQFDASGSRLAGGWPIPWEACTDQMLSHVPWSIDVLDVTGLIPYTYPSSQSLCDRLDSYDLVSGRSYQLKGITASDTMLVLGNGGEKQFDGPGDDADAQPTGKVFELGLTSSSKQLFADIGWTTFETQYYSAWWIGTLLPDPANPDRAFGDFSDRNWDPEVDADDWTGSLARGGTSPGGDVSSRLDLADVSPDGNWLLGSSAGALVVRASTGTQLHPVGEGYTLPAVFSPDMTQLAVTDQASDQVVIVEANFTGSTPVFGEARALESTPASNGKTRQVSWQAVGAARFTHERVPGGQPGEMRFTSLATPPQGQNIIMGGQGSDGAPAWVFGDGSDNGGGMQSTINHTYARPGTFDVTHTVHTSGTQDMPSREWRHTEQVEIPAPKLNVAINWDEELTPGNRFPIGQPVEVDVIVRATSDGVGDLTNITFDDDTLLDIEDPAGALDVVAPSLPAGPMTIEPGDERTFTFTFTARAPGEVTVSSAVTGKDSAQPANDLTDEATRTIRLGQDLTIAVTPTPAVVELEEIDPATGLAPPVPVAWTITVENTSGETIENATIDIDPKLRDNSGRDPAAPFPIALNTWSTDGGGTTTPVEHNKILIDLEESLAPGSITTVTLTSDAVEEGIVDLQVIATGFIQVGENERREAKGNGTGRVLVDQPLLLRVHADTNELVPDDEGYLRTWGTNYHASGTIENISTTEDVEVRVLTKRVGNVVGAPLDEMLESHDNPFGVIKLLEPGERLALWGTYTSVSDGGTAGQIHMEITGWSVDPDTGEELEFKDDDSAYVQVDKQPAGHPATERRFAFDTSVAPPQTYTTYELGWMFTDSFARGFGTWVEGTKEIMVTLGGAVSKLPSLPFYAVKQVHDHADPAVREQTRQYLVQQYAAITRVTLEDAQNAVNTAVTNAIAGPINAWDTSDYGSLTTQAGTFLGGAAPDIVIEAAIPVLYTSRLVKVAGKTSLEAADAAQEFTLAQRIAAKGQKGFQPHDVVDLNQARRYWGMDSITDSKLIQYVKDSKLVVTMRSRSPGSIRRLREGALPKIEMVKAKNVNDIDVRYLGFPESTKDLAVFKEMQPWEAYSSRFPSGLDDETITKIRARYDQRYKEYYKEYDKMKGFARDREIQVPKREYGLNAKDNGIADPYHDVWTDRPFELEEVVSPSGDRVFIPKMVDDNGVMQPFTGDMDMLSITDEAGNILDEARRKQVYKDLGEMGFQHPESLTWDNAAGRAGYINDHGINNPDAEPLLAYTPDGERRAVLFDEGHSHWNTPNINDFAKSFLYFEGLKLTFEAAAALPGVPLPADPPEPPAPYKTLKAGDEQAVYESNHDTPLLRRKSGGGYERWTPDGGWQTYSPPPGSVRSLPQSGVSQDAPAGSTYVHIHEQDRLEIAGTWFQPGDTVIFDPGGPNEERAVIVKLGSLILAAPLQKSHRAGEMVAVLPGSIKQSDPQPPVQPFEATSAPRITGRAVVGGKLRVNRGTWSKRPTRVTYQWMRNGKRIARATTATYRLKHSHLRSRITVRVTARHGSTKVTRTSKAVRVTWPVTIRARVSPRGSARRGTRPRVAVTVKSPGTKRMRGRIEVIVNGRRAVRRSLTTRKRGRMSITLPKLRRRGINTIMVRYVGPSTYERRTTSAIRIRVR